MKRSLVMLALLLALPASARAEEEPTSDPVPLPVLTDTLRRARFDALKFKAEQARKAGRMAEAAEAYVKALEVIEDPLVAGRLGVILVEFGDPAEAADLLLTAIEKAMEASPKEREGFLKAYDVARTQVCRVEVTITEAHTKLSLDGVVRQEDAITGFTMFLPPGDHELRGRLEGFQDGVTLFKTWKNCDLHVTVTPLPLPSPKPEQIRLPKKIGPMDFPDEPPPREPIVGGVLGQEKKPGLRATISAGPVFLFGVASWSPAVGAVVGGSLRPNEYVSIGLEGRAAWLTSGVGGASVSAMTAGGIFSACGHYRWFVGCALGHLGVLRVTASSDSYTGDAVTFFKPGIGARAGARFKPTRGLFVEPTVDVLGLSSGLEVVAGQTTIAKQPPVMFGAQITGGWEF